MTSKHNHLVSVNSTVTVWRPSQSIQVKVIGIVAHKGRLLAAEVYNDAGEVKGIRPLGGHVEFGETREVALRREFMEELGVEIDITSSWRMFENLYEHEGQVGHEYILAASIGLMDASLYTTDRMVFSEDSGAESIARWFSVKECKRGEIALFPDGLIDIL